MIPVLKIFLKVVYFLSSNHVMMWWKLLKSALPLEETSPCICPSMLVKNVQARTLPGFIINVPHEEPSNAVVKERLNTSPFQKEKKSLYIREAALSSSPSSLAVFIPYFLVLSLHTLPTCLQLLLPRLLISLLCNQTVQTWLYRF